MHPCPNCGYCPHCGRSDQPAPIRPAPWRPPYAPEVGGPIFIAPYPGRGGIEVGDRPGLERGVTCAEPLSSSVEGAVSYL